MRRNHGAFLSRIFILCCIAAIVGCSAENEESATFDKIDGRTMGTTYHITFESNGWKNHQYEVDSVLKDVNRALSTYIEDSEISLVNQSHTKFLLEKSNADGELIIESKYFYDNFQKAKEIWKLTNGYFDPTVESLVNYWGFGSEGVKKISEVDSLQIKQLLQHVGFEKIQLTEEMGLFLTHKDSPEVHIDFSALAKGYGVDEVANLLKKRGAINYMVEIGGEVVTSGVNASGKSWRLGISNPTVEASINDFFAIVNISGRAMASSGNYRNYYEMDGQKRFHSINPKTGFPEENRMRGATILAKDCMTADALATACMVMGVQRAKSLVMSMDDIDGFLIFEGEKGDFEYFATPQMDFKLTQTAQ